MRKFFIFIYISFGLLCSACEPLSAADDNKNSSKAKITPEMQKIIDQMKKLSDDEAFADMDRTIKMGNKTRLMITLYVHPKLLNRQDKFGRTPLYNAVFAQHEDIVRYLLAKHADLGIKDVLGYSVLHRAAAGGSKPIVELLLKCGAKYYVKDKKKRTPLFNAALQGRVEAAEVLLDAGDKINRQDANGDTPLHLAALKGKKMMVEFLLKKGADISIENKKGEKPADVAKTAEIKALLTK